MSIIILTVHPTFLYVLHGYHRWSRRGTDWNVRMWCKKWKQTWLIACLVYEWIVIFVLLNKKINDIVNEEGPSVCTFPEKVRKSFSFKNKQFTKNNPYPASIRNHINFLFALLCAVFERMLLTIADHVMVRIGTYARMLLTIADHVMVRIGTYARMLLTIWWYGLKRTHGCYWSRDCDGTDWHGCYLPSDGTDWNVRTDARWNVRTEPSLITWWYGLKGMRQKKRKMMNEILNHFFFAANTYQ